MTLPLISKQSKFKRLLNICWFWGRPKGHIVGFVADPLETLMGTVPVGIPVGLARMLISSG